MNKNSETLKQNRPDWVDRDSYPFQSRYFSVAGQHLHYIDEGEGEVILFVHGTPSWSFEWRNVIANLRDSYRCIAIDHIGFGLSSKPADYDYSTVNHSRTLEAFVVGLNLQELTLVMHDFGGPIGFHFALQHPGRVKRMAFLNTWLWSNESSPEYRKLRKLLNFPLVPFLYRSLNFSARFLMPASFGEGKPSRYVMQQFTRPFSRSSERNGTLAFAMSLLNDQNWFENLWTRRGDMTGVPTMVIWGMRDPVIPSSYAQRFCQGFPGSTLVELRKSGHYPQEEEPEEVVKAIRRLMETK
jgi:pimeloyl-ACP methyl ester carboxylesterase